MTPTWVNWAIGIYAVALVASFITGQAVISGALVILLALGGTAAWAWEKWHGR